MICCNLGEFFFDCVVVEIIGIVDSGLILYMLVVDSVIVFDFRFDGVVIVVDVVIGFVMFDI